MKAKQFITMITLSLLIAKAHSQDSSGIPDEAIRLNNQSKQYMATRPIRQGVRFNNQSASDRTALCGSIQQHGCGVS